MEINWIVFRSVATAVAVFLTLFLRFIKPRREKPKIAVEFKMGTPFCRETVSSKFTSVNPIITEYTYWVRVRVKNSGKSVAHQCVAKLTEVKNGEGKVVSNFDPMQLHWVGTDWDAVPFLSISLKREDYEYLDIVVTQQEDSRLYICGDQFVWSKYQPRGIQNTLQQGSYIMRVTIYGDKVDPKTRYLSVVWGGQRFKKDISLEIHDTFEKAKAWLDSKQTDKQEHLTERPHS